MLNASLTAHSVKELVDYSRNHRLSYGTSGVGAAGHLRFERQAKLGVAHVLHVPCNGGAPAQMAVIGGEIHMYPCVVLPAMQVMKAGKIRALAAMSLKRGPALPDLPTVAEQGYPGYKLVNRCNLYAPAGKPSAIVAAINRAVRDFVYCPKMVQ